MTARPPVVPGTATTAATTAAPEDAAGSSEPAGARRRGPRLDALRLAAHVQIAERGAIDFVDGGAGDLSTGQESALARNERSWRGYTITPRILPGVAEPDIAITLAGTRAAAPVVIAPMAAHRLVLDAGEVATAHACLAAGVPLVVSLLASRRWSEIGAVGAAWWIQVYPTASALLVRDQLLRAQDAGATGVVVTLDFPVMGHRPRDVANRFQLPESAHAVNLRGGPAYRTSPAGGPTMDAPVAEHSRHLVNCGFGWRDLDTLISSVDVPVWVKGVLHADDAAAVMGLEHPPAGLWVSNHGGRQTARAITAARALPDIRARVGPHVPLIADGGIRSAEDIATALALGATAAGVGRPALWALAAGGPPALTDLLRDWQEDLRRTLLLYGCPSSAAAADLRTHHLDHRPPGDLVLGRPGDAGVR